ncbi:MAG TPA: glutamate cyclase domain-containing protein [Stellaceae bacterium]|nr:glutamate cyclase domain-containing protein [Stellaceae bacterium]
MPAAAGLPSLVDRIEALIQVDVGRHIGPLFEAARGGLASAAEALVAGPAKAVGIITGFYVPQGSPPAAETDGPLGAALIARGLLALGIPCRLATDEPCRPVCAAALAAAGARDVPLDIAALGVPIDGLVAAWREAGVSHAISIERCGKSADGAPRNMRGIDIGSHMVPLDDLFLAGPWGTIAIGDGGNEIGMGALPRALIAANVAHGQTIACVTPARHLIVAGVSNWGAYALLGALAARRPDRRAALLACLDEKLDRHILEAMVREGPAVDGVTRLQTLTVDGFEPERHHRVLRNIRALIEAGDAA